jgi:hypothetical protein
LKKIPKRKQYEKEAIKTYRSARIVLMGMILRKGKRVIKKKKNEKKTVLVYFKDQKLNPIKTIVIPMKMKARMPKNGLETVMV